jgi:hypothetical protein
MGRERSCKMGQAEAGQWIRFLGSRARPVEPRQTTTENGGRRKNGMLLRAWANLKRLRIVVTVRRGGAPTNGVG